MNTQVPSYGQYVSLCQQLGPWYFQSRVRIDTNWGPKVSWSTVGGEWTYKCFYLVFEEEESLKWIRNNGLRVRSRQKNISFCIEDFRKLFLVSLYRFGWTPETFLCHALRMKFEIQTEGQCGEIHYIIIIESWLHYVRLTWNWKEKLIPRAQVVSQYLMSQGFSCSFTTETVKVVGKQTETVDSLKPYPSHFCYKWGLGVLCALSLSIIINSICMDGTRNVCVCVFMAFSIDL